MNCLFEEAGNASFAYVAIAKQVIGEMGTVSKVPFNGQENRIC